MAEAGFEQVLTSVEDGILVVTINRPTVRNALNKAASAAISAAMDRLDSDPTLYVAILTGAGGTFCAGMDLKGFPLAEYPTVQGRGFGGLTEWTPNKPVIAAVDGHALAGGFELALGCDLIVAGAGAKFGIPEAKRGLAAGGGGMVRLPRMIPRAIALEMALTGETITAARAYELGLVNRVVTGPAVDGARELALKIAACGPLAVAASKAVIRQSWLWPDDDINRIQAPYIADVFISEDAREGARAFAEKRQPRWQGK